MAKLDFQAHDPSEIVLKCWFGPQETFFIIMLKATVLFNIFVEILIQKMDYLMNMKFKRTVFIVTDFFL